MASNRLEIVSGTSETFVVDLTDSFGEPTKEHKLRDALASLRVRLTPNGSDILVFTTADPAHLVIDTFKSLITINFLVADTLALTVGTQYFWQLELDLKDGEIIIPIDWTPVDVIRGGSAESPSPVFDNTVMLNENYVLPDDLRYMTPGGNPIENAQIRVYLESDYNARKLKSPVGVTVTNSFGRWTNPIFVSPGYTYVVQFFKPNYFGPDVKTIIALSYGQ